jgi:hypothetical protein
LGQFTTTDILLVVDDSQSMADKQALLAEVLDVVLNDTRCESVRGAGSAQDAPQECRYRLPMDAHVGVITTSLAIEGAAACAEGAAHLVPMPSGAPFLIMEEWQTSMAGSKRELEDWLTGVGQTGCGFEAPLEAVYRFLVDPAPRVLTGVAAGDAGVPGDVDEQLLKQREEFLRRDSLVLVVFLTDEDDCSLLDAEPARELASIELMQPGTSACLDDPADPCCRRCADGGQSAPGCGDPSDDERCQQEALSAIDDHINVRCFDQKRRFGMDFLHSTSRYVEAFSSPWLTQGFEQPTENPLFVAGRTREMVRLLGIVGVPWQLLATDATLEPPFELSLRSPEQHLQADTWSLLLGGRNGVAGDPHLHPSIEPRSGLAPPNSSRHADTIHGHEYDNPRRSDLQYSCTFELPEPRDCAGAASSCDCALQVNEDGEALPTSPNRPLCQAPDDSYGQVQYFAKAYPPPRLLEVLRRTDGVVGSICPKTLDEERKQSTAYGYTAAFRALIDPVAAAFGATCLEQPWPSADVARCKVIEILPAGADCDEQGRVTAPRDYAQAARGALREEDDDHVYCELLPVDGDPDDVASAAHSCLNDVELDADVRGYCLIDPARGAGNETLVERCPVGAKRRVRLVPFDIGRTGDLDESSLRLICL